MSVQGKGQVTTFLSAAVVTGLIVSVASASGRRAESAARAQGAAAASVLDGVYTEAQAARGMELYDKQCTLCHGEKLDGGIAPGLTGDDFTSEWVTQTVGDMVEKMRQTMPADDPGKLTPAQATDIAAYILSKNKYPAGQKELATEVAALKQIRIVKPM
jgi:mono/diheme cytochrome c family protein